MRRGFLHMGLMSAHLAFPGKASAMTAAVSTVDRPFAPAPMRCVTIEIAGDPKGKGRPRFAMATGHAYTPQPTRNYEAALRFAGQAAMKGAVPIEGPLRIEILAAFSVPQSWSQKKKAAALTGLMRPTGRPDADNIVKMLDALNGVVWRDDAQIVDVQMSKRYSDRPRLWLQVEALWTGET